MPDHPVFEAPETDVAIWRFMDFTKFVAMLENEGLFFVRADLLGDPFEGSVPQVNVAARPRTFSDIPDLQPAALDDLLNAWARSHEWHRRQVRINCWHMNDEESAAMWKL